MKKLSLILALILIVATLGCVPMGIAFAASETVYTKVLEDLQKDEAFDVSNYPSKDKLSENDKVMDVIQIAESNSGELFLYVYQPLAGKFTATEARISQTIEDNIVPEDYKLTLLDRNGSLEKYKVEQLQFKSDAVRYYFILQLARPCDKQLDNGNTADTVPYGIEKLFTVETIDNEVTYTEEHKDCIELVNKYVGNLRYLDEFSIFANKYTSSHYVAFSTEIAICDIYEVDISYGFRSYSLVSEIDFKNWSPTNHSSIYDYNNPIKDMKITLKSDEYSSNNSTWGFLNHTWKNIQHIDEFVSTENLGKSVKDELADKQWVLRFATSEIKESKSGFAGADVYSFSDVTDVTLLRLNFLSNGKVYNLGVIDNKQTGNGVNKPDNPADDVNSLDGLIARWEAFLEKLEIFWDNVRKAFEWFVEHWWVIIVSIVLIALIVGLIVAIVKKGAAVAFKAIGKVLWWVLKIIFYIVTLPIWLIIWGVRAIKKGRDRNG